jgi:hypothetical protein
VLCTVRLEMPAPRQATPTKKKPLSAVAAQALKRPADPARTFVAVRSCVADELVRTVFTTLTGHGHLNFTFRARLLRGAGGLPVSNFNVGQIW